MSTVNKSIFSSVKSINSNCGDRSIVLFGAGRSADKTAHIFGVDRIDSIVDNAENLWGENVFSPETICTKKNIFVIICTTSFYEVSNQLSKYGLNPEIDYSVSPVLNDLRIIYELESIEKTILFSSGSPRNDNPLYGGGVYEIKVNGDKWKYKKVISGNCYGLIKFNDNYICVDTERGIIEFDANYKILRSKKIPEGLRAHGIRYSKTYNRFYIVGSYIDGVIVLDADFNVVDTISISHKKDRYGTARHHCNDCLVVEDSLYISMFSKTGNYKNDVFDGCILEYDFVTKKIIGDVAQGLWMPHNVQLINGSIHVLNSLKGELLTNNLQVVGKFPAFARGLDYDGQYYYVGQSRNRNYSKNIGVSKNISIDAGIIVFDEFTKVSRLLQLPPRISEIHSIVVL